jgi:hypothetical protein
MWSPTTGAEFVYSRRYTYGVATILNFCRLYFPRLLTGSELPLVEQGCGPLHRSIGSVFLWKPKLI